MPKTRFNPQYKPYARGKWVVRQAERGSLFANWQSYLPPDYAQYSTRRVYPSYGSSPFRKARRGYQYTTNAILANLAFNSSNRALPVPYDPFLSQYEDRRLHSPYKVKPATSLTESYPQMMEMPRKITPDIWRRIHRPEKELDWRPKLSVQLNNAPWWYGFANADKVIICLKRKIRREVINALGFAGEKGQRRPRYNAYSHVRC